MADETKNVETAPEGGAENTGGDPEKAVTPAPEKAKDEKAVSQKESAGKTFTQKELDDIVNARLARAQKSAEEKANKTADEKAKQALDEIKALKEQNACYRAGIKEEYVEDAIALANRRVCDGTDFNAALKAVIERNPHYKADTSAAAPKPITTGVKTENSDDKNSDAKLRAAFGLPPKK